jgi:hypothetical protein
MPNGLAVSQNDNLRRFVFDACSRFDLTRNLTRALYFHQSDNALDTRQLAVGNRADPTSRAVFEDHDRRLVRSLAQPFQSLYITNYQEVVFQSVQLFPACRRRIPYAIDISLLAYERQSTR